MLRSNLRTETPVLLWEMYVSLVGIEPDFRDHEVDPQIRPLSQQKDDRIRAHIPVAFLMLMPPRVVAPLPWPTKQSESIPLPLNGEAGCVTMMEVHLPTSDRGE